MKHLWTKLYILLAILLLVTPSLGMLIFGPGGAAANEQLAARPSLTDRDGGFNARVLSESADYLADHFALRQQLVTAWSELNARLLGSSPEEQVILGREGWLYFSPSLPDYTGQALSDQELEALARHLKELQSAAEARGAVFLFTVAPNKNSLCSQYMPAAYPDRHGESSIVRLLPYLEQYGVQYADLFSLPMPYYRTDTHWTAEGAAMAADALLAALGRESAYAAGPFSTGDARPGDLYEMLYPTGKGSEAEILYGGPLRYTTQGDPKGGDAITIRCSGEGEGRLYCWRDSFGIALYPYLADAFGESVFTRSTGYTLPDGEYDVYLLEIVERNLGALLYHFEP